MEDKDRTKDPPVQAEKTAGRVHFSHSYFDECPYNYPFGIPVILKNKTSEWRPDPPAASDAAAR